MTRAVHPNRRFPVVAVGVLVAALVVSGGALMAEESCCSCELSSAVPLAAANIMPCAFDHPAGWKAVAGDDGGLVQVGVAPPPCATCPVSPGIGFSVARKSDRNAESMEEVWKQVMRVVGTAECGGRAVTFFALPGAEAGGLTGGLKFYVGHGGKSFGGAVTFTCSQPGRWLQLQELFVSSFRTNQGTTFDGK